MSWFSVPEEQFGGMGSSSRRFSFSGAGYAYQPVGGVESLQDVRIPIWSTKCITATWFGPAAPIVESNLTTLGTDRLSGTITNRQSVPLEDAFLAFGKDVYLLGHARAGSFGQRRACKQSQPGRSLELEGPEVHFRAALES